MATISIADNDARVQHSIGGGGNTANSTQFTIDFPFFALDDINVTITNSSGVDTVLTRGTGSNTFAVTGTAVDDGFSGGNITLGSVYTSSTVTISRDIPIVRTSDFATSGPFNISSLNTELDKVYAVIQQLETKNDRALTMAESDDANEIALPNKATRKGNVLAFNATTGAAEAGPSIGSVTNVSAQSTNINTVAGISSDVTTVAGIASNVTTVAGISGNVTSVAGNASNINSAVSNASNINTVAGAISNVNTVGANVSNVNTVAGISSNITTVAGKASLITSSFASDMALIDASFVTKMGLVTSDFVTDMNLVTADFIVDLNALATTPIIQDLDLLATTDFISDLNEVEGIKANVTTVAGISSNITAVAGNTTNINAVNSNASNINAVASNQTNINAVNSNSSNINTVAGISSNIASVVSDASDIGTVATNISDVSTVAGISSNITTVAGISSAVSAVNSNATNINAVNSNSSNINTVAGLASAIGTVNSNSSNINTVASNNTNINTVASANSNITTVAGISSDISTVAGISADVEAVENIAANVTTVAGMSTAINTANSNASNINTVAGAITNVNNVGGSIANVNTVATNLSGVNSFAERYRVGSSNPGSDNDAGDLFFNTTSNALNYFDGSSFQAIVAGAMTSLAVDSTPQLGGDLDVVTHGIVSTSNRNIAITPNGSGKVVIDGLSHPTADGTNGQFLKTDGSGNLAFATVTTALSGDSTPQLGGNLDVNGNSIVSASNGDIAITPNGSGKVILDGLSHPTADGTAGQFLKTDGSGNLAFQTVATSLSGDSSPQLGADLDVVTHSIVSTSNRNIAITPNGSGKVVLDGISYPTADGSANQVLQTDGSGTLSFGTVDLSVKANIASPTFTGTPAVPTAAANTNTTQIASTAFVQQEISHILVLEAVSNPDPVAGDFTNGALFVGQF